jgi:DNA-binding SARP family transcriptional activator
VVECRLLGPIELWVAGRQVDIGPPKRRTVLAALLVDHGRPVTLETLIDRLWDDTPPAQAHNVVYSHLTQIRRLLGQTCAADATPARLQRRADG